MRTLQERVARAMCQAAGFTPDELIPVPIYVFGVGERITGSAPAWQQWSERAAAHIAAQNELAQYQQEALKPATSDHSHASSTGV